MTIEDVNYDDCVRMAAAEAAETKHGVMVQDTAWEGYEEIPAWIMQGYGTMASEAAEQLRQVGVNRPTHVFVQAGVGSLAGAVIGYFTNLFPNDPPKFVVMEARAADCLYQGALAGDGQPRIVEGDLKTIMAGLACGEPNILSWDILRNHVSAFVSCPDWVSARGMRMLGVPVKGDPTVISGESGAVGMGLIAALMETDEYKDLREAIWAGPVQPGAAVLHRGQHRPHEVPQGPLGWGVPHRLNIAAEQQGRRHKPAALFDRCGALSSDGCRRGSAPPGSCSAPWGRASSSAGPPPYPDPRCGRPAWR